jgi:UDP-3-O-[3-hydroxymyristoyl] glucosamine N-acyltransferase
LKLGDLATALGLPLHGDPSHQVVRFAPINSAQKNELAFVVGKKFIQQLRASKAGAVILPPQLLEEAPGHALVSDNPYDSYAAASWLLTPDNVGPPGVAPNASIAASATIAPSAKINANVVIGEGVAIAEGVIVGANCVLGDNVVVGKDSRLFANVTVYHGCEIGQECRIQSGAVIGAEGFGYARHADGWRAIHQTGIVQVGDRVHIGANTTIDRGAIDATVIGDGVILDNQIQIAHNVSIGRNTAIAGCVGIAGSTTIGENCQIGGACNIVGHLSITDNVILSAASLVTRSIHEEGRYSSGMPLQTSSSWRRTFVSLGKLDELMKRVRRLERQP